MTRYDVQYHISTVFIHHCEAEDEADAIKQFKATNVIKSLDSPITHADVGVLQVNKCDEVVQTNA